MIKTKFAEIYNGDCVDVLDKLQKMYGGEVDCIITDPPYNVSRETNFATLDNSSRHGMDFGEWDKDFDITKFISHASPLLKENGNFVCFNAWENLGDIKHVCEENNIYIKRCLVLNKSNPAPFNRDRLFVNDVEFALWGVKNSRGNPTGWTFNRQDVFEKCCIPATVQSSVLHPTMKDLNVILRLVKILTNEGDVVLDCFMGSGTTGVACKMLQRSFIGIELDKGFFDIAQERLKNPVQFDLFL